MTEPLRQCIDCEHASLTKQGPAKCAKSRRPGWFPSPTFPRHCRIFKAAPAETVARRQEQLNKLRGPSA